MSPNREAIERILKLNDNAAVKLAPATSPPPSWQERAELQWISRDRQCRQLVAWFGGLARCEGGRLATVLDLQGAVVAQVTGAAQPLPPPANGVLDYVFEPDPSVLAAGLAGQVAQTHGILPLAPTIPYFTGGAPVHDRAVATFRVLGVMPFDKRRLAAELGARGIGRLEIKCRGVRIAPEELRRGLRLRGDQDGVVLLTRNNKKTIAILAERAEPAEPSSID